jgi:hypothetical protein
VENSNNSLSEEEEAAGPYQILLRSVKKFPRPIVEISWPSSTMVSPNMRNMPSQMRVQMGQPFFADSRNRAHGPSARSVKARSLIRAIRESDLSEGPDCLIAYLSELRFINPKSDTSEF